MMTLLNHVPTLFHAADADRTAAEMQAGDGEGWTYTAVHDPSGKGYSFIEIRDEDGILVGKV